MSRIWDTMTSSLALVASVMTLCPETFFLRKPVFSSLLLLQNSHVLEVLKTKSVTPTRRRLLRQGLLIIVLPPQHTNLRAHWIRFRGLYGIIGLWLIVRMLLVIRSCMLLFTSKVPIIWGKQVLHMRRLNLWTITIPFVDGIIKLLHKHFGQSLGSVFYRNLLPVICHVPSSLGMIVGNALVVRNQLILLHFANRTITKVGGESSSHHFSRNKNPLTSIWIHEIPSINSVQLFKEGLALSSNQSQDLLHKPIGATILSSKFQLT